MCGGGSRYTESPEARKHYATLAKISKEQWNYAKAAYENLKGYVAKPSGYEGWMPSRWRRGLKGEAGLGGIIAAEQGRGAADVAQSFKSARDNLVMQLGRYGLRPGTGQFTSALRNLALGEATAAAGSRTNARSSVLDRFDNIEMSAMGNKLAGMSNLVGVMSPSGATSGLAAAAGGFANMRAASQGARAQERAGLFSGLGQLGGSLISGGMISNALGGGAAAGAGAGGLAGFFGGLGSAMTAILPFSDVRLKENVAEIGTLPATGLPVYEFNFRGIPSVKRTGCMAHEVHAFNPDLVRCHESGYLMVDYSAILDLEEAANV